MIGHRRALLALTSAHAGVGLWIATSTPGPLLSADDVGLLGLARALTGDRGLPLPVQPPYGLLYPALLAPGWAIGLGESAMVTYARVVNALLGATLIPLLFLLLRRMTDLAPARALLGAVVAASLPAAMLHSSIVWTETLLPVVVAAGLMALHWFAERPTSARAAVVVLAAVSQVATHPRMVLAASVVVAAAVWSLARARRLGLAAVTVVGAVSVYAMVEWARRSIQQAAYGSTGLYDAGDLAGRRGWGELPDMVVLGTGTIAYMILATAGLVLVGGWVLTKSGLVGRASVAIGGATVVTAGWFLTGVPRADKWLHGRYIEAVAAPLVAAGVAALAQLRWRAAVGLGASVIAAGVYAAWAGPGDNWTRPRSPVMMLGVEPGGAPFATARFEPGAAALVAIVALALAWTVARYRPKLLAPVLAVLLGVASASAWRTVDELYEGSYAASADVTVAAAVRAGEVRQVAIDPSVSGGPWTAIAWRVGLDDTIVGAPDSATSHVVVPSASEPPVGGEPVGTVFDAVLYRLP